MRFAALSMSSTKRAIFSAAAHAHRAAEFLAGLQRLDARESATEPGAFGDVINVGDPCYLRARSIDFRH
jgi:antirestriction protein ArdC